MANLTKQLHLYPVSLQHIIFLTVNKLTTLVKACRHRQFSSYGDTSKAQAPLSQITELSLPLKPSYL